MTKPITGDGKVLMPVTQAILDQARWSLPLCPAAPGLQCVSVRRIEHPHAIIDTWWVATYSDAAMQPEHFQGWQCLNPWEAALGV